MDKSRRTDTTCRSKRTGRKCAQALDVPAVGCQQVRREKHGSGRLDAEELVNHLGFCAELSARNGLNLNLAIRWRVFPPGRHRWLLDAQNPCGFGLATKVVKNVLCFHSRKYSGNYGQVDVLGMRVAMVFS